MAKKDLDDYLSITVRGFDKCDLLLRFSCKKQHYPISNSTCEQQEFLFSVILKPEKQNGSLLLGRVTMDLSAAKKSPSKRLMPLFSAVSKTAMTENAG